MGDDFYSLCLAEFEFFLISYQEGLRGQLDGILGLSRADDNGAFESDSEFMKGFETGIYLRTKGGTVEEYGCAVPKDAENKFSVAIDEI